MTNLEEQEESCPVCGSPIQDGHCQDVGDNGCDWTKPVGD